MPENDIDPARTTLTDWLDRLAQPSGAPGGGAACGVMTSISAGLLSMVAGYTDHPDASAAAIRLERLRHESVHAAEEDGVHSADFGAALAMPESAERDAAVRHATSTAIDTPKAPPPDRYAEAMLSDL